MNYKVIQDEQELQKFIEWLPELEDGQKYYWSLFARNKFKKTEGLKADRAQLKRGVCNKKDLISKFRKLEVALGLYDCDGVPINQESLAMYITPNPRDMHKAGLKTISELTRFLIEDRKIFNPEAVALNMVQVTGVKKYFDFDVDFKEGKRCSYETLLKWIRGKVNPEAVAGNIVVTRGGFHILVELDKISEEYKKSWYNNFMQAESDSFELTNNSKNNDCGLIPVPGCTQSDFIPRLMVCGEVNRAKREKSETV